jgi:FO synthase
MNTVLSPLYRKLARIGVERLSDDGALDLANEQDWRTLAPFAAALRDEGWGSTISYSRKVFIPLTRLCRDVCHYCTFAASPRELEHLYLSPEQVLEIAEAGRAAGCKEALFTLGDRPEARYSAAEDALRALGHDSTLSYLESVARLVLEKTGLLPHLNPGLMTAAEMASLRRVAPSMGLMLETSAERLSERGGPHYGSPDKLPARRLEVLRLAGESKVPVTTGILIGIGETRRERIEALLAIRALHEQHGQIQEVIVQNFRAKPDTKMAAHDDAAMEDLLWTIAVARLVLGAEMSVQAPPNLYDGTLSDLVHAGINDWGGVSPVTPDHVNPEAPWPHLDRLARETEQAGKLLAERLTVYPRYIDARGTWIDPGLHTAVLKHSTADGLARVGAWSPGVSLLPADADRREITAPPLHTASRTIRDIVARASDGEDLSEADITRLFSARGADYALVCTAADQLRAQMAGDTVTYVVNRNINYTNICTYKCGFCAFSKGKTAEHLRGKPYLIDLAEIARRTTEAWQRGGTEVCLQGGIHPEFTGDTYLSIARAVKEAVPDMHLHAFSPLEIFHGATTLGLPTKDFLRELKEAGLNSLPGTAAEILDDEVRAIICPDKIDTATWLRIIGEAHEVGLRTTATIMFGHVDSYRHWARHLLRIRELQKRTGGITEFVPLPFVHMESPLYLKGRARRGPTLRETILMHAVARLALHPLIRNIQTSWVKLGADVVGMALDAGVNDLGGTLMDESISRAAGASHGQEFDPAMMQRTIRACGRIPFQRTTLYGAARHPAGAVAETATA